MNSENMQSSTTRCTSRRHPCGAANAIGARRRGRSAGGWIFKILNGGLEEFWIGRMDQDGIPITSMHRSDAYVFKGKGTALQVSDTHDALRDSDYWKVVRR